MKTLHEWTDLNITEEKSKSLVKGQVKSFSHLKMNSQKHIRNRVRWLRHTSINIFSKIDDLLYH